MNTQTKKPLPDQKSNSGKQSSGKKDDNITNSKFLEDQKKHDGALSPHPVTSAQPPVKFPKLPTPIGQVQGNVPTKPPIDKDIHEDKDKKNNKYPGKISPLPDLKPLSSANKSIKKDSLSTSPEKKDLSKKEISKLKNKDPNKKSSEIKDKDLDKEDSSEVKLEFKENPKEEVFIHIKEEQDYHQKAQKKAPKRSLAESIKASILSFTRISNKEIAVFFRLLSVLVGSGIPLTKSLETIGKEVQNNKLKFVIKEIVKNIQSGLSFSSSLERYSDIFDESIIGIIKAAEATGYLSDSLKRLAKKTESASKIKSKLRVAMIYPLALLIILILCFIVIMVMVVPNLISIFGDQSKLPVQTQILIKISDFIVNYWPYITGGLIGFLLIFQIWKEGIGKLQWEEILFKLPVIGLLRKKIVLASMMSSLSSLIRSGVPVVKTLDITSNSLGSEMYHRSIQRIKENVSEGEKIGDNLAEESKLYPPLISGMISIGEEVAQIDEVTEKLSSFYEEELDNLVRGLTASMEPIIIVVIGVVVAFFVSAIMEPIMNIADQIASQ